MKVYFDTNILIDILLRREPFFQDSYRVFLSVAKGINEGIVGAGCITDVYYIVNKTEKNSEKTLRAIFDLLKVVSLIDTRAEDIFIGTTFGLTDFEDSIVVATAKREGANYIISRNLLSDFANSPVPAISPKDFIERFN